jgi:hypothetical protein
MQCTLLIPSLFLPREFAAAAYRELRLEALQSVLARARCVRFPAVSSDEWLCRAYEVERQQDWPIAPLTLALHGGEAGNAYCLRADPVHLRVARDRLMLADSSQLDITPQESEGLVAALNQHFSAEGLDFTASTVQYWHLRLARPPKLETHLLGEVAGRDVRTFSASGADALQWRRIVNEIQMLLHDHPLNEKREARGVPAVNSVWLWGGGVKPSVPGRPFTAVWSDDPVALALAATTGNRCEALPANAAQWLQSAPGPAQQDGHDLIVCNDIIRAARYGDLTAWQTRLEALDRLWLAPLVAALHARQLTVLTLVVPTSEACWRFELRPGDRLKFWRRGKPLPHFG